MNLVLSHATLLRPAPAQPAEDNLILRLVCGTDKALHAVGEAACLQVFEGVRTHASGFWLALPAAGTGTAPPSLLLTETAGKVCWPAVAAETERALMHGVSSATPLALALLATLALDHHGRHEGALQLAQAALELAARDGDPHYERVRMLHAQAMRPGGASGLLGGGFGHWLVRLQAAWYAGDPVLALHAIDKAGPLAGPRVAAASHLAYHLFAALALAHAGPDAAQARLDAHAVALRRLAGAGTLDDASAGAAATLAQAACDLHAGDRIAALRGCESAGTAAAAAGRHWLAALAWEQAALQADACGLAAAVQAYRRHALASCRHWGALARAAMLRRAWGDVDTDTERDTGRESGPHGGGIGDIGLSIAHEVNQPLAAIALHAAAARKWLRRPEPDIERAMASLLLIGSAGRQAGDIVRSVQRLAARRCEDMAEVPVDRSIADTLLLLRRPLRKHGIELELALGLGACTIHASRVQLQQVLTNLVVNAIEALSNTADSTAPKRIRVHSRHAGGGEIEIGITDNGPGIAPEDRPRVFGSLFSTKPGSTGMGLSISLAIVRAHGGHIAYEPAAPHGACFRFRLPVHARQG